MNTEAMTSTSPNASLATEKPPRRPRLSRKRRLSKVPPMPQPVKALWDAASDEEKTRAHRLAAVMLQVWLGKMRRAEAAAQLELTPLRVWQLSQQAVAGMVAGLLKQPRARLRQGVAPMSENRDEDPKWLKRKITELERKLKIAEDVIALLREMPGQNKRRDEKEKTAVEKVEKADPTEKSAGKSGEETRSVPERVNKRPGMRRSTPKSGTGAGEGMADGAKPDPAP
jgi:hypothetical protein